MDDNLKIIAGYFALALLSGVGIMLIVISSARGDSWWPTVTIIVTIFSIIQIMICYNERGRGNSVFEALPWMFFGFLISFTWFIPVESYRVGSLSVEATYMTIAGCMILQAAMIIFARVFYFQKNSSNVYGF